MHYTYVVVSLKTLQVPLFGSLMGKKSLGVSGCSQYPSEPLCAHVACGFSACLLCLGAENTSARCLGKQHPLCRCQGPFPGSSPAHTVYISLRAHVLWGAACRRDGSAVLGVRRGACAWQPLPTAPSRLRSQQCVTENVQPELWHLHGRAESYLLARSQGVRCFKEASNKWCIRSQSREEI